MASLRDDDPAGTNAIPDQPHDIRKVSEILAEFRATLPEGRVSMADAVAALGSRSFGSCVLVLAVPTILPIPLGVSVLFNLPIVIFAAQMVAGRGAVALPAWLLGRSMASADAGRLLDRLIALVCRVERLSRPRLLGLVGPGSERWLGFACFLMAVIATIPLPLVGWLPGFGLVLIGLGLIERDGNAVVIGLGFGIAALVFFLAVAYGLLYAGNALFSAPIGVY
ncbi:MAG: exopolysaccharide biosynthesis protein [Azospirillum sp.]|nr:exopolysaccharide biosynthesis protein [Azospirillum sp.]